MYEHDGAHELMWTKRSGSRRPAAQARLSQDDSGMGHYLSVRIFWHPICRSVGISASYRPSLASLVEVGREEGRA